MKLELTIEGRTREAVLAQVAEYLAAAIREPGAEGLERAAEAVPGVTANAGGGGGP